MQNAMTAKKDIANFTPEELDQYLNEKYGFGLFDFGWVLSALAEKVPFETKDGDIFCYSREDGMPRLREARENKKRLVQLKIETVKLLDKLPSGWKQKAQETQEDLYDYALDGFESEIACAEKKPGRPLDSVNLLLCLWACHVNKRNPSAKIQWKTLIELHKWFWDKLSQYAAYSGFRPPVKTDSLKAINDLFFREKRKWGRYYSWLYFGFIRIKMDDSGKERRYRIDDFEWAPIYFGMRVFRHRVQMLDLVRTNKDARCCIIGGGVWSPVQDFIKLHKDEQQKLQNIIKKNSNKEILIFPDFSFLAE